MSGMLKIVERVFLASGLGLIALAAFAHIDARTHQKVAIDEFERIRTAIARPDAQLEWSDKRKLAYEDALQRDAGKTLAVLRIPSSNIEVPVLDSTSDLALNRGAGHVEGTALPGEPGNVAIAAHRDGFFRGLKDIRLGDEIEVTTLTGQQTYTVTMLSVVDPLNVSVLDPTDESTITLITCYPFYFMGAAPERFIVRATLN